MYIYPDNLKSKAVMWLWELKDLGIIAVGTLISILALTQTGIMIPLAVYRECVEILCRSSAILRMEVHR